MLVKHSPEQELLTSNETIHSENSISLNVRSTIKDRESFVREANMLDYSQRLDLIRFVAISSIVWGHALLNLKTAKFNIEDHTITHSIILQLGRFGTIMFFLLSGYLLSDKISGFTLANYLKYRKKTLIVPWLTFLSLFVVLELFKLYPLSEIFSTNIFLTFKRATLLFRDFIFYAAYWYIPVSIISACVLIMFRKHLESISLMVSLMTVTAFYEINLYFGWISSNHTKAIFAYILFMWLGIMIKRNLDRIMNTMKIIPIYVFTVFISLLFFLSSWEGMLLTKLGSGDPYASLRFSNATLSILIFLLLLKIQSPKWIALLEPRKYVFGVYLIHCIVVTEILTVLRKYLIDKKLYSSLEESIIIQILLFLFLFQINYIIAAIIANSRYAFLFGKRKLDR